MNEAQPKLGIVAGAGALPLQIMRACERSGRAYHTVAVDEFADDIPASLSHVRIPISKIGATIRALKAAGCRDVTFAGKFVRPDGRNVRLRPDFGGLEFLARLAGMLWRNDDSIHKAAANMFATRGFRVVSPLDAVPGLAARKGCLTVCKPTDALSAAFRTGLELAKQHGASKQGQAVVVENGAIIARETRAGTDAMLLALGPGKRPAAFLVKAMTPSQLRNMDPPAIGESTVLNAAKAGLGGILVEADRSVIVDEDRVRARAEELALFVCAESLEGA